MITKQEHDRREPHRRVENSLTPYTAGTEFRLLTSQVPVPVSGFFDDAKIDK